MDFKLSEDHVLLQEAYRDFAVEQVKPLAAEIDEKENFPLENIKAMGELGFLGIPVPEEYGGAGVDTLSYVTCVEELSKVCASTGVIVSAHTSLCIAPILEHGTPAQKQAYLPKLATGEWIGAFGLTEPGAGTDAAMQKTTAEDKGDHWLLNGSKAFITNAGQAHVYIIMAMTDKSLGTKGISAFIVEDGFPGFKVGAHEKKMGIRGSSTCELIFENCVVPKENLLGEVGQGFKIAMQTLDGGRIGIAAQAVGIAQGAIDETIAYTQQRVQFGKRISQFQNTQFQLADMQTRVDAAILGTVKIYAQKRMQALGE